MKLYLVRHTITSVKPGICYGQTDVDPAETFEADAARVLEKIGGLEPQEVFTSPLKRCTMLAKFCGYAKAVEEPRIMEMNFGFWELMPWNDITDSYAMEWMENYFELPTPDGESLKQMTQRVEEFFNQLKKMTTETVMCFTHAGVIRIADYLLKKQPIESLFDKEIEYGGVYTFDL